MENTKLLDPVSSSLVQNPYMTSRYWDKVGKKNSRLAQQMKQKQTNLKVSALSNTILTFYVTEIITVGDRASQT
jgi:hypothetical protein